MLIDGRITLDPADAIESSRQAEEDGFAGIWYGETSHDPFLPLMLAAEHTERISLGTGIAVAFARSPMTLATTANDLQRYSKGRFLLGLGSQVKPHIEKRFSMPWSSPAARMREFVLAMRAIWACWNEGEPLAFRGEFYRHTLMSPMFSPEPNPYGPPKVLVAGVGELMTEVAGEVADGLLIHAFTTERYLREVTIPAVERGLDKAGHKLEDFQRSYPGFVVTGETDQQMDESATAVRKQIAFYASTPSYRGVLDLHGWGDLHENLHTLSKRGEWDAMGQLIDDDVLGTFAVIGKPSDIPALVTSRFAGLVTRFDFYAPYEAPRELWQQILKGFADLPDLPA